MKKRSEKEQIGKPLRRKAKKLTRGERERERERERDRERREVALRRYPG